MYLYQRGTFLVLTVLCVATANAAAPTYIPVGVQQNVAVQTVTDGGWSECYKETFDKNGKSIEEISAACGGAQLMMACRPTGGNSLQLLAQAPKIDVMTDTGGADRTTTHQANGVAWYFNSSWSWGFAAKGQVVDKLECDTVNLSGEGSATRMCAHTNGGTLTGGFRCGGTVGLNGSAAFERIFYTADGTPSATNPGPVTSVSISNVGDGALTVSWTAPADNGSPITKYTVTGVPGGTCTSAIEPPATTPDTSCTVTGLTNGTPYKFTVVATNAIGDSVASPESAEAVPSADITFVGGGPTITLAGGVVATAYSQPLLVTGGLPPYTFYVNGELPPGLELNTTTGVISGTPTTPGAYIFSILAMDSTVQAERVAKAVHVAEQTFTIVITAAPVPQASVACTPSELTDSANQISNCTVTLSLSSTQAMSINLDLPAASPRYSTSCVSPITIAANETTATCTITATENTTAGDGDVTAQLSIAPPTVADAYSVSGSPAQVVIKDDDKPAVAAATPVPTLGGIGLMLLSGLVAGSMGLTRRRKSN